MNEAIAIEPMAGLFDARAEGYDDYVRYVLTETGIRLRDLSRVIP